MPRTKPSISPSAQHTITKHGEDKVRDIYEEHQNLDERLQGTVSGYLKLESGLGLTPTAIGNIIEAGRQLAAVDEANRRETNVEFVTRIMEDSGYGALAQAFVIEGISRYAESVSGLTVEQVREQFGKSGAINFINPDAWHGVATEISKEIKERTQ